MTKQRTTMALDEKDRANIEVIREHLAKGNVEVSAAEAIRYALRQTVAQIKAALKKPGK